MASFQVTVTDIVFILLAGELAVIVVVLVKFTPPMLTFAGVVGKFVVVAFV